MKNRLQLELSLSDILLEKINHKENFSVSTQSRFGTNINEVFHFDLKQKILYLNYSRKNYSGKNIWFHEIRKFMKFSMVTDSEQNITFNVFLVPNNKEKSDMTTTLYFDFLSTGIVDKVI